MDGFWSKRCLNYRIDVPDKIGSISSCATTSMVVKNGTKKTFEGFLNVLNEPNEAYTDEIEVCRYIVELCKHEINVCRKGGMCVVKSSVSFGDYMGVIINGIVSV